MTVWTIVISYDQQSLYKISIDRDSLFKIYCGIIFFLPLPRRLFPSHKNILKLL